MLEVHSVTSGGVVLEVHIVTSGGGVELEVHSFTSGGGVRGAQCH